jgi:hypothetical protein
MPEQVRNGHADEFWALAGGPSWWCRTRRFCTNAAAVMPGTQERGAISWSKMV